MMKMSSHILISHLLELSRREPADRQQSRTVWLLHRRFRRFRQGATATQIRKFNQADRLASKLRHIHATTRALVAGQREPGQVRPVLRKTSDGIRTAASRSEEHTS